MYTAAREELQEQIRALEDIRARANLAKALLYAINGGVDEISGKQAGRRFRPIESAVLEFDEVWARFDELLEWLARTCVNTLNIIHNMHDKYCYERAPMVFYDRKVEGSNGFTPVFRQVAPGVRR
jgi:pyruvate-formate lyase